MRSSSAIFLIVVGLGLLWLLRNGYGDNLAKSWQALTTKPVVVGGG